MFYLQVGAYEQGRKSIESSLESCLQHGYQPGVALAWLYLGIAARGRGEHEAAAKSLEASKKVFRSVNYTFGIARTVHLSGAVAYERVDYSTAADHYWELSQIAWSIKDKQLLELCEKQLNRLAAQGS